MFVDSIDIVMKIAVMIYEDGRKLKCVIYNVSKSQHCLIGKKFLFHVYKL